MLVQYHTTILKLMLWLLEPLNSPCLTLTLSKNDCRLESVSIIGSLATDLKVSKRSIDAYFLYLAYVVDLLGKHN